MEAQRGVKGWRDGGTAALQLFEGDPPSHSYHGEATTLFAFGGVAFSCPTSSTKPVMSWDLL